MDLLSLSDFNLVARHGGIGRAARASGRPKATLSRRVAELEESLGYRLFERGARTLRLTEEGRALHERTAALLGEIDDVAAAIGAGSGRPRGRLRISAPLLFAHAAMGRLAAGFILRHPEMQVDVTAEDRTVDVVEEGYDLVIRVNPRPEDGLVGRCFLHDRLVLVAVPAWRRPAGGESVPAVLLTSAPAHPWRLHGTDGAVEITPKPILKLSSLFMVRDAVHAGVGAALLPLSMVAQDIARGRLARWGDAEGGEVELWALYASRRLLSARVAAFLDYLRQAFPHGTSEELAEYASRPAWMHAASSDVAGL
jgi:DNA-binding transcriptional LysR family regulator